MWRDTREARLKRYQECLRACPQLYQPTEAMREKSGAEMSEDITVNRNLQESGVGAYRTAEKEKGLPDGRDALIDSNVCDYVLAPALNGYVLWVLKEALGSGKKRLYFLARDGYFMYHAAKILCEKMQLPIECRYLSCSRYSIRIPMFHLNFEDAMEYVCRGGIDVTMRKVLNRAGLDEEEKERVLQDLKREFALPCQMDDLIPYAKMQEIRSMLEACESFRLYLDRHSRAAMPNLEGYLRQEGLLDDIPYALVDSGWVGSMQKVLHQLLAVIRQKDARVSDQKQEKMEGYYWGLYELPAGVDPKDYHCYYFSPGGNLREKVYFSNCLFEGIFSAPHGMTMGYTYADGRYRPVYAGIPAEHWQFMEATGQRLMMYTESLAGSLANMPGQRPGSQADVPGQRLGSQADVPGQRLDCQNDKAAIQKLLQLFMGEPTKEEAELYGKLHFSDDVLDYGESQIAAPLSEQELTANHVFNKILSMLGVRNAYVKESAWYEGSAVRNGHRVKRHLRGYAGYKYLLYLRKKRLWRKIYG